MEERTFDLTVPVTRAFRGIWTGLGVIWIVIGFLNLEDNAILGAIQLSLGLLVLPFVGLARRLNRYIIAFKDGNLEIDKGLFIRRRIPWTSISQIRIELMRLEFVVDTGKSRKIDFTALSYNDNQTIKPRIIDAATEFAKAKGIPVQDGRSG
ncbi:MAG: hypothetical protein OYM47_15890 [Gemmatimonadota bacterium]|nr:hypothetical protein [Gemmatimonadota bacterium]